MTTSENETTAIAHEATVLLHLHTFRNHIHTMNISFIPDGYKLFGGIHSHVYQLHNLRVLFHQVSAAEVTSMCVSNPKHFVP